MKRNGVRPGGLVASACPGASPVRRRPSGTPPNLGTSAPARFSTLDVLRRAVLLPLLVAAGGCVEGTATVRVARNGSGTIDVRAVAPADAATRIQATSFLLTTLGAGGTDLLKLFTPTDASTLVDRASLEQFARELGPQVRLVAAERVVLKGRNGFAARYAFPDIRGVRWTLPAASGRGGDGGGLAFDFVAGATPVLKLVPWGASARSGAPDAARPSKILDTAMTTLFEGFRVSAVLQVEGEVLRSNAAHRDGRGATLLALDAAAMKGPDLWTLLGLRTMADAAALHRRAPAGVRMQDPAQPLVIVFR